MTCLWINTFTWVLVAANCQLTAVQAALYRQQRAEHMAALGAPAAVIQTHLVKMRKIRRWCWPMARMLPYARQRLYNGLYR